MKKFLFTAAILTSAFITAGTANADILIANADTGVNVSAMEHKINQGHFYSVRNGIVYYSPLQSQREQRLNRNKSAAKAVSENQTLQEKIDACEKLMKSSEKKMRPVSIKITKKTAPVNEEFLEGTLEKRLIVKPRIESKYRK